MMAPGLALAQAAAELIGTSFRLHGRDPATGVDCVGLLCVALARCGRPASLPNGYALRSRQVPDFARHAERIGFVPVSGPVLPGDLVVARPAPCQVHLVLAAAPGGFVHAHAGLGRVVHSPPPLPWPLLSQWRLLPSA